MAFPSRPAALLLLSACVLAALLPRADSLCYNPPPGALKDGPNITIWGQETLIAFGSGFREVQGAKPGVEGPWLAPIITGVVLVLGSAFLAVTAPTKAPLMYWLLVAYPFFTALVEFARVNFDASRYGFLTATWHNLPEYAILLHLFFSRKTAEKGFPLVLLWVWMLDVFILFVPSLDGKRIGPFFGGLVEQVTGICCDYLLIILFTYLYSTTPSKVQPNLKSAYLWGLLGSIFHMLEIIPLVVLLVGFVDRPFIPVSVIVALTTPITFFLYGRMAQLWTGDAAADAEQKKPVGKSASIRLLAAGIALGLLTILGPVKLFKPCTDVPTSATSSSPAPSVGAAPVGGFVQNTFAQGSKLFDQPGAGIVAVSTLPVMAEMEWQVLQAKIEPGHAVVPLYADAPMLIYVAAGIMSALITEGSGAPKGVQSLEKGDELAVKRGMVFALENNGPTTLHVVAFINTAPSVGRFRGAQTLFPLFGAQGPLSAFTTDILTSAFNTTRQEVEQLRSKYRNVPFVFKVASSPRYTSPVPPAPGYVWSMDEDIQTNGLNTPGAGSVSVGNTTVKVWPILNDIGFTPVLAHINKGSLLAAHTHVGSVEIDVITAGTARVQLVSPNGQLLTNVDVVPGDVFVIPPGYSHVHKTPCSDAGEHDFIAIQSDLLFHTFFTSGAFSVLKPFVAPEDAGAFTHQKDIGFAQDYACYGAATLPGKTEL